MTSGIYIILNKCNQKVYVGSSANIEQRWRTHKSLLKKGIHKNNHLQSAWNIYGEESFVFIIIEEVETPYLISREKFYVNLLNSRNDIYGYNLLEPDRFIGTFHHSEETKEKIGKASKGKSRAFSQEHLLAVTNANKKLRKGKTYEEIYGEEKAKDIREKVRERALAHAQEQRKRLLGKSYDELYGEERALQIKEKQSNSRIGKEQSETKKEKCRLSKLGKKNSMYKDIPNDVRCKIVDFYTNLGYSRNRIAKVLGLNPHQIKKVLMEEQCL